MEKVIVSACLLGEYCRYDGTTKKDEAVLAFLEDCDVIPFCPEAPVLGTPRGRISVVETAEGRRVLRDSDNKDVTERLLEQTRKLLEAHFDADAVVLKSKSPSCGIGTTPILDKCGHEIGKGNGIAAEMLKQHFTTSLVIDENHLPKLL